MKPGERGEIEATFSSKGRSGKQAKTIFVHSNDPENPIIQLTLQAEVKVALAAVPDHLYFRELRLGHSALQKVNLKNLSDEPLKILSVTVEGNFLTVEIPNVRVQGPIELKPESDLDILVQALLQDAKSTSLSGKLLVKTDLEKHPLWTFPVFASMDSTAYRISAPVQPQPQPQ